MRHVVIGVVALTLLLALSVSAQTRTPWEMHHGIGAIDGDVRGYIHSEWNEGNLN